MSSENSQLQLHNQQLLEDIEQISAAASHELKDQLREALAQCEVLRHLCGQEHGVAIDRIEASVHTIIDNVFVLRNYAYLAQNTETPQWVLFEDIMARVEGRLAKSLAGRDAKLVWDKAERGRQLYARPSQLETLLTHLIDNGFKFNHGPHPQVEVQLHRRGDLWECSVTDNGDGMESEFAHLVFGLFKRADPQNLVKGRGAGLSYCKKIVENHGGEIFMETAPEQGCKVTFTLAASEADSQREEIPAAYPAAALRPA